MKYMAKKKSTVTRTIPSKRVTKTDSTYTVVMQTQPQPQPQNIARGTWASVMSGTQDERVKPKSWSDWAREKLHVNRLK
jgi:hypothetical protein